MLSDPGFLKPTLFTPFLQLPLIQASCSQGGTNSACSPSCLSEPSPRTSSCPRAQLPNPPQTHAPTKQNSSHHRPRIQQQCNLSPTPSSSPSPRPWQQPPPPPPLTATITAPTARSPTSSPTSTRTATIASARPTSQCPPYAAGAPPPPFSPPFFSTLPAPQANQTRDSHLFHIVNELTIPIPSPLSA